MRYKGTLVVILVAAVVIGSSSVYCLNYVPPRRPAALFRLSETIVVENRGNESVEFGGLRTEAFLDFSWQEPRIVQVLDSQGRKLFYVRRLDKDGNPYLIIDGPPNLNPNESYTATVLWEVKSFPRNISRSISVGGSESPSQIPESLMNYTKQVAPWSSPPDLRLNTSLWKDESEYHNKTILEVAEILREGREKVLEIVLEDVRWITSYIGYESASPTYPIETARNRKGDCDDQSNLLIALLRLQGIPSFLMMGQVYLEGYANWTSTGMEGHLYYEAHHTAGHAWVMVHVPPWGWLPCDPVIPNGGGPLTAVTEAFAASPITLVYQNLTGVHESSDYIESGREQTERAEREETYFSLIQDMEQLPLPSDYVFLRLYPAVILAVEVAGFGVAITAVSAYEFRKAKLLPFPLRETRCFYCGAGNPADAVYCGYCGRRIVYRE